ncbi:hypothetical protein CHS0354_019394 [Potamilus streckersoni]|uniref:Uncharacterized protein n=1 Tax=Potamilus streckersoni TaxID=2493646 RepID=A0AAE0SHH6_9BIVA|nr:hypothetical protein CHS0354_019394 [Potamilus streckersoni]
MSSFDHEDDDVFLQGMSASQSSFYRSHRSHLQISSSSSSSFCKGKPLILRSQSCFSGSSAMATSSINPYLGDSLPLQGFHEENVGFSTGQSPLLLKRKLPILDLNKPHTCTKKNVRAQLIYTILPEQNEKCISPVKNRKQLVLPAVMIAN